MKLFASLWTSLRTWTLADVLWRVSVLVLPWQTRWFVEGPQAGGAIWEQGRTSVYLSMGVMVAFSLVIAWQERVWQRMRAKHALLVLLALAPLLFPTRSWHATGQTFVQLCVLAAWVWAMARQRLPLKTLLAWSAFSVSIPALFGVWQMVSQQVGASTLLGMAAQDPLVRGVSVVQVGAERWLRAYGSFPHPNIFGGWMAFGLLTACWYVLRQTSSKITQQAAWLLIPLLSLALYASFSRSAWLACGVGIIILALQTPRFAWKRGVALIGLMLVPVMIVVSIKPELVFTRLVAQERLERYSFNQREASVRQAFGVVKMFPFGTGLGSYRLGLQEFCFKTSCAAPAEPPHIVPLLMLAEFGWLRSIVFLMIVAYAAWQHRLRLIVREHWPFGGLAALLMSLDHYLWSLWAGQALVALLALMALQTTARTEQNDAG